MPTVNFSFDFDADVESWTMVTAQDATRNWANDDGDPDTGYLHAFVPGGGGSTERSDGVLTWTGTWEDLGVPAGATVDAVTLTAKDKNLDDGDAEGDQVLGPYGVDAQAGGSATQLIASRNATADEGSWTSRSSGGPVSIPPAIEASDAAIKLTIGVTINITGDLGFDTIALAIDYTPGGTAATLAVTLDDVTADLAAAFTPAPAAADLAVTLDDVTAALAAAVVNPATATIDATLDDVTASLAAAATGAPSAATLGVTLDDIGADLRARHVPPPSVVAAIAASVAPVSASLSAHAAIPGLTFATISASVESITADLDATFTPGDAAATIAVTLDDVAADLTAGLVNPVAATLAVTLDDIAAELAAHTPFVAALGYHVYGNAGSGPIDYGTPLAETTDLTADVGPLAAPGDYLFTVRAYDASTGLEEQNVDAIVRLVLDATGADVTARPNAPADVHATDRGGGSVRVTWTYNPAGQGGPPAEFRVWATEQGVGPGGGGGYAGGAYFGRAYFGAYFGPPGGGGGAGVDYGAEPEATTAYAIGTVIYAVTLALDAGTAYAIGVRAAGAGDLEEPNTTAVATVTPADVGPDPVTSLVATAT